MGHSVFTSDRSAFNKKNDSLIDIVTSHMAMDVEVALKTSAGMPVDTGNMKAQTRHFRTQRGGWRVEIDVGYAAVQEAGQRLSGPGAPTKRFTNYTTAGTSAGFFMRAIESVIKNRLQYILEAKAALNL